MYGLLQNGKNGSEKNVLNYSYKEIQLEIRVIVMVEGKIQL